MHLLKLFYKVYRGFLNPSGLINTYCQKIVHCVCLSGEYSFQCNFTNITFSKPWEMHLKYILRIKNHPESIKPLIKKDEEEDLYALNSKHSV